MRIYYIIVGEILIRIMRVKSRSFKELWRKLLDFAGVGNMFFLISSLLFYLILETSSLLAYDPPSISVPAEISSIFIIIIYINGRQFRKISKFSIYSRRKPSYKKVIKITVNVILGCKKVYNRKRQKILNIVHIIRR
jgi:hypothetical protein